ncbi:MAG: tRNA1(Val) (adenine(37)-N6)-methyltransferase [Deltaproteobacteria bacterium]|nr:tRNA1(Val) (adenine(37)-N6)-methyltransferase [Deltaproteobacteria bacterium]
MKYNSHNLSTLKKDGETMDELLGGRLVVLQKEKGYRFSLDSLLLASFVRLKKGDSVIDLGTGSGVVSLITAQRKECGKVAGIEIQEELVDMARRNVVLNGLQEKIEIFQGDIKRIEDIFGSQTFEVAVFNPPYRKMRSGRINPDEQKSIARHEIRGTLRDFLKASGYVLKRAGRAYVIYPATRMVGLLAGMREAGIEPKRMQMVHSHYTTRGEFVLVEGTKGGREEMKVFPPLVVYMESGEYTEAMNRIFKELSALPHAVS